MKNKARKLFVCILAVINSLLLAQTQKISQPPPIGEVKLSDIISIKKITINGVSYTSSPITIQKNSSLAIQVEYTVTKQTSSFQIINIAADEVVETRGVLKSIFMDMSMTNF